MTTHTIKLKISNQCIMFICVPRKGFSVKEEMKEKNQNKETENMEDRKKNGSTPWLGGVVLILVGVVFLLRQVSGFRLDNWWALFILIPAIGSLATAWRAYESADRKFTTSVRGSLIGGLMMVMIAAIFLFNLNWALFFPAILIITGLGILASSFLNS